ncbi:unnamed protein product [Arabis nemorensis]|uniref:Uncharacterized protein n=1 Tax=Arabis nemorensis TaxID=586526 RepID=A0A565BS66_9BRAS|nr:unnamed protein product [Arabis nemorensis]
MRIELIPRSYSKEETISERSNRSETDLSVYFDECFSFIDQAIQSGGGVLLTLQISAEPNRDLHEKLEKDLQTQVLDKHYGLHHTVPTAPQSLGVCLSPPSRLYLGSALQLLFSS